MKYILILLLVSFHSLASLPDNLTVIKGCRLFDNHGKLIKIFPGMYCAFLPDGRLVSADRNLTMLDAQDQVLWTRPWLVHHQIKISSDGKRIITLLSESKDKTHYDKFAVIDLEGKIIHQALAVDVFKDKLDFKQRELNEWEKHRFGADYEVSHFNSIDEIPANTSQLPFLKEGNFIVHSSGLGACVISADMTKSLDCRKLPDNLHVIHDVQVTPSGHYIYLNNEVVDKSGLHSSAVEEYDPKTHKKKVLFSAEPKVAFYSPVCGGVQIAGNLLIVSHVKSGAYIINRKTGKIDDYLPNHELSKDQEIKALDLSQFLTARKIK